MSNQKFNKNGSNQFGNWSFTKHRFNTEKHPVITTKQLKRAKLETVLSSQEKQMLGGLTNTLQVEENEAIRIALYEASRSVSKGIETYRRHSDPQSTLTAHRGRNKKIAVKLPGTEKIQATKAAKQIGISEREFVRLSIIWLQKSILDESICRLTNSYKISQKKLFEEWVDEVYKTTDDYQSPVKNLKQAHKESYEAAELRGIEESTQLVEDIKAWGLDVGRGTLEAFNDEYGNFDFQGLREYYERMHQEPDEVFHERMSNHDSFIQYHVDELDCTEEEAERLWTEQQQEIEKDNQELDEGFLDSLVESSRRACEEGATKFVELTDTLWDRKLRRSFGDDTRPDSPLDWSEEQLKQFSNKVYQERLAKDEND